MKLLLFLVLGAASVAFAVWVYRRRELPVPGRWIPATLRALALLLALLLLLDPRLPTAVGSDARWVLVDNSISMSVGPPGAVPWDSARVLAEGLRAEGARLLRFGHALVEAAGDSALAAPPGDRRSLLVPGLERAAEMGAREVVVLSDLRLEDPVEVRAALARLGLSARFVPLGREVRNAGVTELALAADPRRDEPVEGLATVFASGASAADSLVVEVREEGRLVWSARAPAPAAGRLVRLPLTLPPPAAAPDGGEVRYEARVALEGDAFGGDDRMVAYALADSQEGALVAVSFSPDWEFRHLLPALALATGLPARGFVRAGDGYLPTGPGGGPPLGQQEVAGLAERARLVVLHGLGAQTPAWARRIAAEAPRVLVFASDPDGARAAGIGAGGARAGEWYVGAEPPPSAIARELAGLAYPALPPLRELLRWGGDDGASAPLDARLRGAGAPEPALLLRERPDGGRVAVAMASGWWRWALRPGPAEEAYRRVWSAVAGWLLASEEGSAGHVRPAARVIEEGAPVEWTGGGVWPLGITVTGGGRVVMDTTLAGPAPGMRAPPLPEGTYRYVVRAGSDSVSGRFDVLGASAELWRRRAVLPDTVRPAAGARDEPPGRPLRTYAVPWLILIGLLCGEWVMRRRRGLR